MKRVAEGVSRPHLTSPAACRARKVYAKGDDEALLRRIRRIVDARPSYGYRRVTARLNRERPKVRVNHERVYRVMKQADLLLARHGRKPNLLHDGKVITMASDLR